MEERAQSTISLLDIQFNDYTLPELLAAVREGVGARDRRIIANHNLHSLFLFHRNLRLREFYRLVHSSHIDGMPLVWIARKYGYDVSRDRRITYVDFSPPLLEMANQEHWRIFYIGSRPEACVAGTEAVRVRYPGIKWEATNGYFDMTRTGAANQDLVRRIRKFAPDILMVGMGMPRQEQWIAENHADIEVGVILPCGAAIDYIAGAVPTPPRWAGRMGLEWLFRLFAEPRRLASRYLIEPWYVIGLLLRDRLKRVAAPK
ncbi:WecB/TagA/CpsF family glycosyltransferase [Granulicella aggregans]|nr:WecB/TagA/CpsF family glycosyltransferase [Granulicella aggregans]